MKGITSHSKKSNCVVLVDWENLRIGLHKSGYLLGPCQVLAALLDGLATCCPKRERRPTEVQLHCQGGFEYHSDRVSLAKDAIAPAVRVCPVWDDKNMADVEIALEASLCLYRHPDHHVWFVSADNDLARIAQFLTQTRQASGRRFLVAYTGESPGVLKDDGRTEALAIGPTMRSSLASMGGEPVSHRTVTRWDVAAWALRQKAAVRMNDAVLRGRLSAARGQTVPAAWGRASAQGSLADDDVDIADDSVALLWRKSRGTPFDRDTALALLGRRLAGRLEAQDIERLLNALSLAALVRLCPDGKMEVPSFWREGLLRPVRRVVLLLLARGGTEKRLEALSHHSQRFIRPNVAVTKVDRLDADDTFEATVRALEKSGAVRKRRPDSTGYLDVIAGPPLVNRIDGTARRVLAAIPGDADTTATEAAVHAAGIFAGDRWLRVLRETGLAEHSNGFWTVGQLARRPPWVSGT